MIMRTSKVVVCIDLIEDDFKLESLGYIHDYEDFKVVCINRSH